MPLAHLRCARRTEPVGRLESFVFLFLSTSIRDGGVAFSKRWICSSFFSFYSLLLGEGCCWFYSTSAQRTTGRFFRDVERDLLRCYYVQDTHPPSPTTRVLGPRTTLETCLSIRSIRTPPVFLIGRGKICLELPFEQGSDFLPHRSHHTTFSSRISAWHFSHHQKKLGGVQLV
jgi:hypothetical protein